MKSSETSFYQNGWVFATSAFIIYIKFYPVIEGLHPIPYFRVPTELRFGLHAFSYNNSNNTFWMKNFSIFASSVTVFNTTESSIYAKSISVTSRHDAVPHYRMHLGLHFGPCVFSCSNGVSIFYVSHFSIHFYLYHSFHKIHRSKPDYWCTI